MVSPPSDRARAPAVDDAPALLPPLGLFPRLLYVGAVGPGVCRRIGGAAGITAADPINIMGSRVPGRAVYCQVLSSGTHSYDYIPLFVPFFDIPVSLDNFLYGIASIYDRFYLPRLDQLFEED